MEQAEIFAAGHYRYVPSGVMQYSGGAAAMPGHAIRRAVFARPVPLAEGFERIARLLRAEGRPLTALCGCELRSPGQFSEDGFARFNAEYVGTLRAWGIADDRVNPVPRSNVCPQVDPPAVPSFHAFSYTVPSQADERSFVIAGSSEVPEGHANYKDHLIAYRDISPEGMRKKARWVLGEMERRMRVLGYGWDDCTGSQLYIVHDPHSFLEEEFARRGAMRLGLTWHFVRPPVVDMEFEMDCRRVLLERVLPVDAA